MFFYFTFRTTNDCLHGPSSGPHLFNSGVSQTVEEWGSNKTGGVTLSRVCVSRVLVSPLLMCLQFLPFNEFQDTLNYHFECMYKIEGFQN